MDKVLIGHSVDLCIIDEGRDMSIFVESQKLTILNYPINSDLEI